MKIFLRLQEFSNQRDEQHIKLHLKPILSLIVSYEKEPENLVSSPRIMNGQSRNQYGTITHINCGR